MDYFSFKKSDEEYDSIFDLKSLASDLPSPPPTPATSTIATKRKRRFTNPSLPFSSRRLDILIVDDNSINLQILSRILCIHLKHHIEHIELVESGVKALEILKCRSFDLILMDIDMPILNGIEVTQRIRSSTESDILSKNKKIPIIAVTTNTSSSWRQKFTDIGMNGCIAKPISTVEFKNTLAKVLELPSLASYPSTPQ